MARQLVSYDDLAAPENPPSQSLSIAQNNLNSSGPSNNGSSNNRPVSTRSADTPATQPDFIGPIIPVHLQETTGSEGDYSGSPTAKKRKMNASPGGQGGQQHNRQRNAQHNGGKQKGKWKNNKRSGPDAYGNNNFKSGYGSAFNGHPPTNVQHWDEPELEVSEIGYEEEPSTMTQGDESMKEVEMELSEGVDEEEDDEDEEEESRHLTQEEIWDDSALIAAWDAANEEYEAVHGKNKDWKKGRVHKSPLWYNKPPDKPKKEKGKAKAISTSTASAPNQIGVNSKPHASTSQGDAALSFAVPEEPGLVPAATGQIISDSTSHYAGLLGEAGASYGADGVEGSVDEAFTRALGAMYWTGYWTAMYHARRASFPTDVSVLADAVDENEEEEERLDHELTEALISTQR